MRRFDPAPKRFGFSDGEDEVECSVDDPQAAYEAFGAFADDHPGADFLSLEDEAAGEGLALLLGNRAVARIRSEEGADDPQVQYVAHANGYGRFVMRFLEDGWAGLEHAGQWFDDIADLDATPEVRGERRAAAMATEQEAVDEVVRIWHDSGIVDESDEHYVFFHLSTPEELRAERAELVSLIATLGLDRVDPPAGAEAGEVWVRKDPRVEAEIERWS